MGSYQGAVAGTSLRRWKGAREKRKKKSVSRVWLEQRGLHFGHLRLREGSFTDAVIQNAFLCMCSTKLPFSLTFEKIKVFSVFITPTRVLGQMSAVHREWIKNQVGALHTDSQAAQSTPHLYRMQILATHGTLENTSVWKITVFSTHTLSQQLEQKR